MTEAAENAQQGLIASTGLELWKANQAVRLAELRLAAQAAALSGAQTRATTIIGWVLASIAIMVALTFKTPFLIAGCIMLTGWTLAGFLAAMAVWPLKWGEVGAKPQTVLEMSNQTEIDCQQSIALYYQEAIVRNANRLRSIRKFATGAWLLLLTTPVFAWIVQLGWPMAIQWAVSLGTALCHHHLQEGAEAKAFLSRSLVSSSILL